MDFDLMDIDISSLFDEPTPVAENRGDPPAVEALPTWDIEDAVPPPASPSRPMYVSGRQPGRSFEEIWANNDLYFMGGISICVGVRTVKVDFQDLGFSPEQEKSVKEAKISGLNRPLFEAAVEAANRLELKRSRLQRRCPKVGGEWVWAADQHGEMCAMLLEMHNEYIAARQELVQRHPQARREFLSDMYELLKKFGKTPEQARLLVEQKFAAKFPTLQTALQGFRLEIPQPRFVPSLKTHGDLRADFAESQARIAMANRSREEQEAIRAVNELTRRSAEQAQDRAIAFFEQQILDRMQRGLDLLSSESLKPGALTGRTRNAITNALTELREMVNTPWASSMAEAMGNFEEVARMANRSNVTVEELRSRIANLSEYLIDRVYTPIDESGDGMFAYQVSDD